MRKSASYGALVVLGSLSWLSLIACGGSDSAGGGGGGAGVTGGGTSVGGLTASGGSRPTAGSNATGGSNAVVGSQLTGGTAHSGGASATGGNATTGGSSVVVGGASATGGTSSAGGSSASGGAGGASAIQTTCDSVCTIITGASALSACQLLNCPTKCVAVYNDPGVAGVAGCQAALLTVLQCGAGQPVSEWSCYDGFPVPLQASTCVSDILTLGGNTACTTALSAANQAN